MSLQNRAKATILCLVLAGTFSSAHAGAGPATLAPGMWLEGVTGSFVLQEGRWCFLPQQAQPARANEPNQVLELLPSALLEYLEGATGSQQRCMVWGQLELYRGRRYLFATMWRWLDEKTIGQVEDIQASVPDQFSIPSQIAKVLGAYQANGQVVQTGLAYQQAITDEVGRLVYNEGRPYLVTTPVGIDARSRVYPLILCSSLEGMEVMQSRSADPIVFNVSGLLVFYKGQGYLLILRSYRQWGHGNLGL
ncbi:MAG: hypothetical protein QHH07_00955 [Sedimentisphaerales bacterium]|nr:hypothetical protein [Sedimentisphaerales bacterium]